MTATIAAATAAVAIVAALADATAPPSVAWAGAMHVNRQMMASSTPEAVRGPRTRTRLAFSIAVRGPRTRALSARVRARWLS